MKSTQLFEQIVQVDRSSVADEFLERTAPYIFEKESSKARVELRCLTATNLSQYRKAGVESSAANPATAPVVKPSHSRAIHVAPNPVQQKHSPHLQTIDVDLKKLRPLIQVWQQ